MSLNPTNLYIQAAPLPATFRGNPNDLFTEMVKRMRILSPSGTNFIFIGDTEPTSNVGPWLKNGDQWYVWDETTKRYVPQNISASFTSPYWIGNSVPASSTPNVWLQTTADAAPYGAPLRWFMWNGAKWIWPHDIPPNSNERRIWVGTEADLWFHDGGDGTDPALATETTGAMWAVDTAFNLRSPRGALTGSLDPNTTTGADSATVTIPAYLPAHSHMEALHIPDTQLGAVNESNGSTTSKGTVTHIDVAAGTNPSSIVNGASAGGGALPTVNVPTVPASLGVYFIKRSARRYYTP